MADRCPYDPRERIWMHRCPECGCTVVAGMEHPPCLVGDCDYGTVTRNRMDPLPPGWDQHSHTSFYQGRHVDTLETDFTRWLEYRELPPETTLMELIEHEREIADHNAKPCTPVSCPAVEVVEQGDVQYCTCHAQVEKDTGYISGLRSCVFGCPVHDSAESS